MQPTAGDVHVNVPLTNISVAFLQNAANFVADRIFPNIPVSKQSDRYYTYDRGMFNRDEMKVRAPGAESAGVEYTVDGTPNYFALPYAIHHDIPDQRRANSDSVLEPDMEATQIVTMKALIKREKLWAAKFFAGGIWTAGDIDGVAAAPGAGQVLHWSDAASNPIEDIRTGRTATLKSTGFEPNTLVIGQEVYDKLADHPDIIDRIKYGQTPGSPAMVTPQRLAALFEVERLFVMKSIENTAAEGATNVHAFIGGKKALLCYATPSPGLMIPTAGYTFSWTGYLGAQAQGQRVSKFRMEHLKSDRVEMEMAFDQKLIAAELGYFFDTIIA
jgi:hypothetical protein